MKKIVPMELVVLLIAVIAYSAHGTDVPHDVQSLADGFYYQS